MLERLETLKPAAAARTHLLLASALWSVVGALLLLFGTRWLLAGPPHLSPLFLPLALVAGVLKAHFVLRRTAGHMIDRIRVRGDGHCIGGFVSLRSWLFVMAMMGLGYSLRHGLLPRAVVGWLYVAVGTALLLGATLIWRAWYASR